MKLAQQGFLGNLQGPNFLPYAAGGGTENVGAVAAVNDMLVRAPNGRFIVLFPFWPAQQPATFTRLRTKGGFIVSAAWNNVSAAVESPVTIIATVTGNCTLQHPWPQDGQLPTVSCPAPRAAISDGTDRFLWFMAAGETCTVNRVEGRESDSLRDTPRGR